jgi:hypothetical protein
MEKLDFILFKCSSQEEYSLFLNELVKKYELKGDIEFYYYRPYHLMISVDYEDKQLLKGHYIFNQPTYIFTNDHYNYYEIKYSENLLNEIESVIQAHKMGLI